MSTFIIPISSLPTINETGSSALSGQVKSQSSAPFSQLLNEAINNVESTGNESRRQTYNLAMGNSDDMHTAPIAAAKSQIAVNFASNLTNKALTAYNDLIKMQI